MSDYGRTRGVKQITVIVGKILTTTKRFTGWSTEPCSERMSANEIGLKTKWHYPGKLGYAEFAGKGRGPCKRCYNLTTVI